jgi:cbb3-type cytochrome oxidase maturation protein
MNVLVYLVPVALMLGLTGLIAFLWSLKSGQYDDLDGAAFRILTDDDMPLPRQSADVDSTSRNRDVLHPERRGTRLLPGQWKR